MAEQILSNNTDTPSILHIIKEPAPLETHHVNSLICRSLSNKLNILPVVPSATMTTALTPSTTSLGMDRIEVDSIVRSIRSIRRQQSTTNATGAVEGHVATDDIKPLEPLTDANKCYNYGTDDGECDDDDDDDDDGGDDSFDDEEEVIIPESLNSSVSSTILNYVPMICPICLEPATLQSTTCCTFHCCNGCWRAHISSSLNEGRIKMLCPSNDCNKYLARETIVNFIHYDSTLYERYIKLYTNANQNPRAKTCPRCSHLYSLDTVKPIESKKHKKIPKQVQCSECSLVWCFRCSAPWHENLTCKQFVKGDKLVLKWMKQKSEDQWNARKCPKCSSFIQRAGGCPHMTCSSCSCEFCYLCGRRYFKIPIIGQHSNKFSVFGCPYNLHPQKPWLRRTIRGVVATGVVVASPILVAGAVTAAVVVLPPVGIYRLVKRIRSRRSAQIISRTLIHNETLLDENDDENLHNRLMELHLNGDELLAAEVFRLLRERVRARIFTETNEETINEEFPLEIYADMDVENLFSDDDRPLSGFRTCPTTPTVNHKKIHSQSLNNLTSVDHSNINRYHSVNLK